MLIEQTLFGKVDKVQMAIDRLKEFEPKDEGYYVAFSGGKDSVVILDLCQKAGVRHDTHYNLTTVDPPELVRFIKEQYKYEVEIHRPEKTMWQLIVENGQPPLRQIRYCCRILKERGGDGRVCVTGVRWQESHRRAKRQLVEACYRDGSGKQYLNPIIEWTDDEVWEYIRKFNVPYCSLYDEGWKRLGCVCCPNANQKAQAERWPKLADSYRRACIRAYNAAIEKGLSRTWKDGNEMYEWWISGQGNKDHDQEVLFE